MPKKPVEAAVLECERKVLAQEAPYEMPECV